MLSPGILGTYWLLAAYATTALWSVARELGRRTTRRGTPTSSAR